MATVDAPTRERIEKSGAAGPILIFLEVALNTADAQKRIDHYIDYFGGGGSVRRSVVSPDPCGESLLDAGRAHRARRVLIS